MVDDSSSQSLPAIDFKELYSLGTQGEGLQQLTRLMGRRLFSRVSWSGRGPDDGRDLLFTEDLRGTLRHYQFKWLVSCKDFARSSKFVSESDVGEVRDKVEQHGAQGFLLVTTTTASSGLKKKLDKLDRSPDNGMHTCVWDSAELTSILLRPDMSDVFQQFFPKSSKRIALSVDDAFNRLKQDLPEFVIERIRRSVDSFMLGGLDFGGIDIVPDCEEIASLIDDALVAVFDKGDYQAATTHLASMDSDTLLALAQRLDKCNELRCEYLLIEIIQSSLDSDLVLNAYQYLLDNRRLEDSDRLRLATFLDDASLDLMLGEEIALWAQDELMANISEYHCWADLFEVSSHFEYEGLSVESIELNAKQDSDISFSGEISVNILIGDAAVCIPGTFHGHTELLFGTYVIDGVDVDTSSYFRE
ncbi:restriction endonuclease [bacterium]|nr:restriction endonuclease [bacterium]